ncbi:MAG TPA: T9SS type A sorting domain-containing protein [Mucilaginibacter sp.]|nr:T9SS type A sorting domain-containing protein [Mucilaginibacter sp.]
MKRILLKIFIIPLLFFVSTSYGQTVYDWTNGAGTGNTSWKTPSNWKSTTGGVTTNPATTYPGQTSNTDMVQFAMNNNYYSNAQRPNVVSGDSISVKSVTIGDNSNTNNVQIDVYVRIDGILNVTDTLLQQHSNNQGLVGTLDSGYKFPPGYDYHIQTYLYGKGKLYAGAIKIGDNTVPAISGVNNITRFDFGNGAAGLGLTTVVSGDFIVNSVTQNDPTTHNIISVNNANCAVIDGTLTINGTLKLQNTGTISYTNTQFQPQARFGLQVFGNGWNTILNLKGAHALSTSGADPITGLYGSNYYDFYVMDRQTLITGSTNWDKTTVIYSGNVDQEVYTNSSFPQTSVFDNNGGNYNYLEFSGSGTKTVDATTNASYPLSISGDITLDPGTETVNLSTNNPTLLLNNGSNMIFTSYGTPPNPNYTYTLANSTNFISGTGSTFQNGSVALTIPGTTTNGGTFNTGAGALTMTGAFTNTGTFNQSGAGTVTASSTTSNSGVYNQGGSGALTFTGALTNSGTVNQTSSGTVACSSTATNSGTYNQNGTGTLTFTGAATNTGTINDTNTGAINLNGTFNNSGSAALFKQSAGAINFNTTYTNTGTFRATGGTENLSQSGTLSLVDNSSAWVGSSITPASGGTTFFNVNALNSGTVSMTGTGQFYVASTGTLNMSNNTTLTTGNILTLVSDVNGAATVTTIPSGCTISGNVDVQRYVSANRAYRLVSSPVYGGNDGTNNYYGLSYLETNTYLTGDGGGFDKAGNPTLYLYRENNIPQYTTFFNSNYRGIANITNPAAINMDDPSYPVVDIPVGSGYLFYFRGSRKQASLATLTTPGAAATTDTLNAVGTLNTGNITVHDWYTPSSANLGYTTISGDLTVEGMNLVGNPYASSIDWDQYGSGIIVNQVSPFSYKLIPTGAQGAGNYDVYQEGTNIGGNKQGTQGTANANIIASGEGFFVQAIDPTASLTFTEAAKTNTLVTGGSLYMSRMITTTVPQYLRLQLALDTMNTDGIIVNFNSGASTAYKPQEDAIYRVGTGKVSLSSLSSDNKALAINTEPLSNGLVIPLKVAATVGGAYTLNMKSISGIPQIYDVWLKDAFTKDSINMRTTASYSFTISTSDTTTFGSNRFSLVMEEDPALAYKLLSFTGDKIDGKPQVQLVWKTQNEQNYTHFTIQRSTDNGKTFDVIGSITSSGLGAYSFLDKSPSRHNDNQYRLKQEDISNNITYSSIVTVRIDGRMPRNLNLYPNPALSTIYLDIDPKAGATSYSIRITNSCGTVVKYAVVTDTHWQDNVSRLLTGTYLVQVVNDKDNSIIGQAKFVKL